MNNHSPPSVSLHPPGLVCSLHASVPCHGLAPAVCLPSTFFSAWHTDALSLSSSICLCLSLSFPILLFSFSSLSPSLSSSLCVADPNTPIKWTSWLCERKERRTKKSERMFCHWGNKGRSNLSSSLLASWLNVYPVHGVVFFLLSLFRILWYLFSSGSQLLCLFFSRPKIL